MARKRRSRLATATKSSAASKASTASDALLRKPKLLKEKPPLVKKSSLEEALLTIGEVWRDIHARRR
jgi:hypothetical protein